MSPMVNTTTSTTTKKANIRTMSRLFRTTVFSLELSLSRMRFPHGRIAAPPPARTRHHRLPEFISHSGPAHQGPAR